MRPRIKPAPQPRRAAFDPAAHPLDQLGIGYIIGDPAAPARGDVLHHRLRPVQRLGKDRIRGLVLLELGPQRAERLPLRIGQEAKDTRGGGRFGGKLRGTMMGGAIGGMDRHIAGVDLDQIMQNQHADDATDLDARPGIPRQNQRIKRKMPAVLGAVLVTRGITKRAGAIDRFQLIGLGQKGQPPAQIARDPAPSQQIPRRRHGLGPFLPKPRGTAAIHIVPHDGQMIGQRRGRQQYLKHRLHMIHALCHACIRRLTGLEFPPQRKRRIATGQHPEQPPRGGILGRGRVKQGLADNGVVAGAGIVLGALATVLAVVFVFVVIGFYRQVGFSDYTDCMTRAGQDQNAQSTCVQDFRGRIEKEFGVKVD